MSLSLSIDFLPGLNPDGCFLSNLQFSTRALTNPLSDPELQRMIRDPEQREAAFRALMEQYQERLYRLVFRMTGSHEDTDDLLQDIFLKVWLHLQGFAGNSKLFTWLYRIAVNETLHFLERRVKRRSGSLEDLPHPPAAETGEGAADTERKLQTALNGLPARQRLVFGLRYYEEMDYRQMALLLDVSEGALKASFHHAVKKIRQNLEAPLD
jgi:RNA polymerase sigma factor (sigma-70 family)